MMLTVLMRVGGHHYILLLTGATWMWSGCYQSSRLMLIYTIKVGLHHYIRQLQGATWMWSGC